MVDRIVGHWCKRILAAPVFFVLAGTLMVSACANHTDKIDAAYVSPLPYQNLDCKTLNQEFLRVNQQIRITFKKQDDIADNDSGAMAIGLILFWPALFMIDDDDKKGEVSRLKGELNAIEQTAITKNCLKLVKDVNASRLHIEKMRLEREKARYRKDEEDS